MLRYILAALGVFVLLTMSLIPDDAYARGGRGGWRLPWRRRRLPRGRHRGRGMHAGRMDGSAGRRRSVCGAWAPFACDGRSTRLPAIPARRRRPSRYGGGCRRGYGAAAVGAAAAYGAYGYGNRCYYDAYGQYICPPYDGRTKIDRPSVTSPDACG